METLGVHALRDYSFNLQQPIAPQLEGFIDTTYADFYDALNTLLNYQEKAEELSYIQKYLPLTYQELFPEFDASSQFKNIQVAINKQKHFKCGIDDTLNLLEIYNNTLQTPELQKLNEYYANFVHTKNYAVIDLKHRCMNAIEVYKNLKPNLSNKRALDIQRILELCTSEEHADLNDFGQKILEAIEKISESAFSHFFQIPRSTLKKLLIQAVTDHAVSPERSLTFNRP